jgi:hypothetical protein
MPVGLAASVDAWSKTREIERISYEKSIMLSGADSLVSDILTRNLQDARYEVYGTVFMREPGRDEMRLDLCQLDEFQNPPTGIEKCRL